MDWETIKKVLAVLVEYFKAVFEYFEFIPAEDAE